MMEVFLLMIEYHFYDKIEEYLNLHMDLHHINYNKILYRLLINEILFDRHLEME